MAKKKAAFVWRTGARGVIDDRDWMIILGSLLHDRMGDARELAQKLLKKSRQGRQVMMLRLVHETSPTIADMQKATRMSRRTIFRYLNSLESYGVRITRAGHRRYALKFTPMYLRRLL